MKKIFSLALALCMLIGMVSLSSCTQSRAELVKNALKNTQELESLEAKAEIDVTIGSQGFSITVPIVVDVKGQGIGTSKAKMYEKMTLTAPGQSVSATMYADEDWLYVSESGVEYKISTEDAADMGEDPGEEVNDIMRELPEEALDGASEEKYSDGRRVFTVDMNEEDFNETFDDLVKSLGESVAGTGIEGFGFEDAVVKITVKNGYISEYDMEFKITTVLDGVEMDMIVDVDLTIIDPGQDVTVLIPDSYKAFPEFSY